MNRNILLLLLLATTIFAFCKKGASPSCTTTPLSTFAWKEDGRSTTISADSAFFSFSDGSSSSYITAYKGGSPSRMLQISLSGNATTTFNVPSDASFTYWQDTTYAQAVAGTIIVTSNSGGRASGTINIILPDQRSVTGTFTNIPVQ